MYVYKTSHQTALKAFETIFLRTINYNTCLSWVLIGTQEVSGHPKQPEDFDLKAFLFDHGLSESVLHFNTNAIKRHNGLATYYLYYEGPACSGCSAGRWAARPATTACVCRQSESQRRFLQLFKEEIFEKEDYCSNIIKLFFNF